MIDIREQAIYELDEELLSILLMDRTTEKNIVWATDNYISLGKSYSPEESITIDSITGENTYVIQPRVSKSKEQQLKRTREKAEVFTPSWLCNKQNNMCDNSWFGSPDVFNKEEDKKWITNQKKIKFPEDKTWKDYVKDMRLEIACGEAPYLVSRYDTVSGKELDIIDRIGIIDRKLRVINENVKTEKSWFNWVVIAYQSTYGFEYQGDNLLLARENLLHTFVDNMKYKFSKEPTKEQLKTIATIISWNIWQMDGLTMNAPFSQREKQKDQLELFDMLDGYVAEKEYEPIPCKIYDWVEDECVEFRSIGKGN